MPMVENMVPETTEPAVAERPESDQLDGNTVSLTDVLGADAPTDEPTGEEPTGAENTEGAADPQPEPEQPERTYTQAELQATIDKVFGERANGLRKQFEREHEEDFRLAGALRETFPGLPLEEISERLLAEEVRALSEETGWDEATARAKIAARREFARTGRTKAEEPDPHFELLSRQIAEINKRENVNMLAIIEADPYLTEQVNSGEMDIKDAYLHHVRSQAAKPAPRKAPPVEKRTGAAGVGLGGTLTDEQVAKIDEQLKRGLRVAMK